MEATQVNDGYYNLSNTEKSPPKPSPRPERMLRPQPDKSQGTPAISQTSGTLPYQNVQLSREPSPQEHPGEVFYLEIVADAREKPGSHNSESNVLPANQPYENVYHNQASKQQANLQPTKGSHRTHTKQRNGKTRGYENVSKPTPSPKLKPSCQKEPESALYYNQIEIQTIHSSCESLTTKSTEQLPRKPTIPKKPKIGSMFKKRR